MRIIIYSAKYFYTFFSLNHAYVTYITYFKKETKKHLSESSIISQTTQPVCNPIRGRYIYMLSCRWWHSLRSFTTGYRNNTPVGVSLSPLAMYRYTPSQTHSMHPASWLPRRGIAHAQKGKRPPNQSSMTFPSYKAR